MLCFPILPLGLTFPRSIGLLIKILVTSCCFFAWLLFNFSISPFLLNKKTFQQPAMSKSYSMFHVCSFLGKKKNCFHGTAVNLRYSQNSPTSHLRWANHQLSFLITWFGRWVAEDVFENTWRKVRGQVQSHVCSIVVIYLSRILLEDLPSVGGHLVTFCRFGWFGWPVFSPMVPWKMWGLQSQCFLEKLDLFPLLFKSYERKEDGAATFVSKLLVKNSLPKIAGGKVA